MPSVNPVAAERIVAQDEAAREAGFNPALPWFAVGTRLISAGHKNYQQSRLSFDTMPSARDALGAFIETVQSEQRIDYDVAARDLHMEKDGRIIWAGREFVLDRDTFGRLVGMTLGDAPKPTSYWMWLDAERRSRAVNDALNHSDATMKLRSRLVGEQREIFAITSQRYATVDSDRIAHRLLQTIDPETRTSVLYRGTRATFDFLWHSPLPAHDIGVGEIYRAAQQITTDDDGTERIRGKAKLSRAVCINLTTVDANQDTFRRVHRGRIESILEAVQLGWDLGLEKLEWFLRLWDVAKTNDIRGMTVVHGKYDSELESPWVLVNPNPISRAIFSDKDWRIAGASPQEIANAVDEAWFKEPDWSLQGFSNAITRAAHEAPWSDPEITEELENAGGRLITTEVSRIPWGMLAMTGE